MPREDESAILDAARFMDSNECTTVIAAATPPAGTSSEQLLLNLDTAALEFRNAARKRFNSTGEW